MTLYRICDGCEVRLGKSSSFGDSHFRSIDREVITGKDTPPVYIRILVGLARNETMSGTPTGGDFCDDCVQKYLSAIILNPNVQT